MRKIDLEALRNVVAKESTLRPVFEAVADTLEARRSHLYVGCGATGRLSLSLEYLWRQKHPGSEQVFS